MDSYLQSNHRQAGHIRFVLAVQHNLDCMALTSLFRRVPECQIVGATCSLEECSRLCRDGWPDLLIIDATYANNGAFETATTLLYEEKVKKVLFLDERTSITRIKKAMSINDAGYVTKESSLDGILRIINKLINGQFAIDTGSRPMVRIDTTRHGAKLVAEKTSIAQLTARELEVMQYIAKGLSVRETAQELGLAESTVDNHKSRLNKKLGVHKVAQLTLIAMREGLID